MSRDTVFSGRVMAGVVEYRRLAFRALVLPGCGDRIAGGVGTRPGRR